MRRKKFCALVCCAALMMCGCGTNALLWMGNVTVVNDVYFSQQDFENWYMSVSEFDRIMPETLCDMLAMEGELRDESALLAFARYEVIRQNYGEAPVADAEALLQELGVEKTQDSLACAVVYCTIDACRNTVTEDVAVTDEDVHDWYLEQVRTQTEFAQSDLFQAQENYVRGAYDVTVYVPEGLRHVQVMAISCSTHGESEAFSIAQSVWRNLLYGESFDALFREYNESDAYADPDGASRTFCIYEGWQDDPAITLLCENLDAAGQMCGPTIYGDMCYIMRYVQTPASGAIAFELIEEPCYEATLEAHKDRVWSDALVQMQSDAQVRFAPYR